MSQTLDPIPNSDDLIGTGKKISGNWYRWLSEVLTRVLSQVQTVTSVHRTAQAASIAATTLYTPTQTATFRVNCAVQVTTAATVNSSIAATVTWTANGVAQTKIIIPANAGNLTTTNDSGSWVFRPDSALPIRYSTTYITAGATSMVYGVDVVLEQLT